MKKLSFLLIAWFLIGICFVGKTDEGMWLPNLIKELNYTDMQKLGIKLTPEQIYDINHSSLKDAIFQLLNDERGEKQGFCTGEIISPAGLMLTNHHCAYQAIATLSSVSSDLLTHGFWAKTRQEELPIPGLSVSRVVLIEDVTKKVLAEVTSDMSESKRNSTIEKAIKNIEKEAKEKYKENGYSVKVKEMFEGGEFYLFVFEVFNDVRLVGAPPSSIGKFGGDTDNWMWPRHTGDFSLLRVYMSPDGKPASYSKDNIPYRPLYYLPISLDGIKENDFTMIMGFPGQTERYLPSAGMIYKMNTFNPIIVRLLGKKLEVQKSFMDQNDTIRIAIADEYAALANGYKLFKGEANTLKQSDAIMQRQKLEKDFSIWAKDNPKYSDLIQKLEDAYNKISPVAKNMIYISLGVLQSSVLMMKTQTFATLAKYLEKEKENKENISITVQNLKSSLDKMYENYFPAMDKKVFVELLKIYYADIPKENKITFFDEVIMKKYKGSTPAEKIEKFADDVYSKSIFTCKTRMKKFLDKPSLKTLNNDPMYQLALASFKSVQAIQGDYLELSKSIEKNQRIFIEGLREFQKDRKFYPDANSTLRLTYGQVKSYKPRDAVYYHWITYIDGVIEKRDETNDEFKVPQKLVDLYNKKDFGQYADETGNLPVAFITNNDITGGNSGSPIMNARGELIGTAFDGNWEWLASNLIYNDNLQRTINCDIRYVLWVIDKFAEAGHLINEMKLVKDGKVIKEPQI